MSDPAKYRSKEELESYKNQDPIIILLEDMKKEGYISDEEYKEMDDRAKKISTASVEFAEKSPEPAPEELYSDVFA